jgi:hypothetical protein
MGFGDGLSDAGVVGIGEQLEYVRLAGGGGTGAGGWVAAGGTRPRGTIGDAETAKQGKEGPGLLKRAFRRRVIGLPRKAGLW